MKFLRVESVSKPWGMYESLEFVRSPDLDFLQGEVPVFGFRLALRDARSTSIERACQRSPRARRSTAHVER